eukprot:c17175_g1_i1 orf=145-408(+)
MEIEILEGCILYTNSYSFEFNLLKQKFCMRAHLKTYSIFLWAFLVLEVICERAVMLLLLVKLSHEGLLSSHAWIHVRTRTRAHTHTH